MGSMPDFGMDDGVDFCWLWLRLWLGLRLGLLSVFGSFWRGRDVAEPILQSVELGPSEFPFSFASVFNFTNCI